MIRIDKYKLGIEMGTRTESPTQMGLARIQVLYPGSKRGMPTEWARNPDPLRISETRMH